MSFDNPLDPVYRSFSIASDCFRVVARTVQMQHEELIGRTHFARVAPEEASPALEGAARQAADLAVLALFASFERFVIAHLQAASHLLAAGYPQQYATRLADKFTDEVEYWRFGEILNLFKAEVDPHLIGQVKQIKRYRDRIAHKQPRQAKRDAGHAREDIRYPDHDDRTDSTGPRTARRQRDGRGSRTGIRSISARR
jgi:hypothetical protein